VEWQLRVPAHGTAVVGYRVTVAADGATRARLTRWARDLDALVAQLSKATALPPLRSLTVSHPRRSITIGQTVRLALSGVLSNGQNAPQSVLSAAVWSTANPAVATVSASGEITGRGPGTTRVTVRAGSVSASAVVTVTSSPGSTAPNPSPDSGGSRTSSPSPKPNPTPTLTPTPLVKPDQRRR
jgi:Bacterial Ig-like domain (group 2)